MLYKFAGGTYYADGTKVSGGVHHRTEAKDGFYYLTTLANTIGDRRFTREIATNNGDVWVYEYADDEANIAYALWCPTSDGTRVNNFGLYVGDATSVTLVEAVYGDLDGVRTTLTPNAEGYVSVDVSENPVYVVIE